MDGQAENLGYVHPGQGWRDFPRDQGCGREAPGGNEAGEGDEGGGQGTVDGWAPGAGLGQERTVSWTVGKCLKTPVR